MFPELEINSAAGVGSRNPEVRDVVLHSPVVARRRRRVVLLDIGLGLVVRGDYLLLYKMKLRLGLGQPICSLACGRWNSGFEAFYGYRDYKPQAHPGRHWEPILGRAGDG